MTDDELELRKAVERAAEHDAQHVGRSLNVPAPSASREHVVHHRKEAAIGGLNHRLRRRGGMEIDRDVQRLRALQNWPIELIVEVAPLLVSVDEGAREALAHSPFQLGYRLFRRSRR